jgi:hypothetical protein
MNKRFFPLALAAVWVVQGAAGQSARPTGGGFARAERNYAQGDVRRGEQAWSGSDVVSPGSASPSGSRLGWGTCSPMFPGPHGDGKSTFTTLVTSFISIDFFPYPATRVGAGDATASLSICFVRRDHLPNLPR